MRAGKLTSISCATLLLGLLPLVVAHDHEVTEMISNGSAIVGPDGRQWKQSPPSYFRHQEYAGWIWAHVALMIVSWVFLMPVALMLSIARSRYHLPAQLGFHLANSLGILTGFVYNHATPNLYQNNAHHPIGWVATILVGTWTIASLSSVCNEQSSKRKPSVECSTFSEDLVRHDRLGRCTDPLEGRLSRDSGQGTERNSASLFGGSRQNSSETVGLMQEVLESSLRDGGPTGENEEGRPKKCGYLGHEKFVSFISDLVFGLPSSRARSAIRYIQVLLERLLLLLGFLAATTGFITLGGIFRGGEAYSGAAHFIKGGIFFWYGVLTLGRWMGAFSEFGWPWNLRPTYPLVSRWKAAVPSAEFIESFVIWFYGTSNVFLEHLQQSDVWSSEDFEHMSITALFFGGGLLGMLIESSWVREAMNSTVVVQMSREEARPDSADITGEKPNELWEPKTHSTSINPMPALVIMLLGILMSSHHQESMVSTMLHSQWGSLFVAFALARGVTYLTLYLKPPTSYFPTRPPSELIAAFCLIAGGLIFMVSASDTVDAIESNGLDAMIVFTIGMGLTAILMAWEIVCFSIKGWAVRREKIDVDRRTA